MRSSVLLRSALVLFLIPNLRTATAADGQAVAPGPGHSATPPAYLSDPHFTAAIAEGKKRTATGELNFAIDAYRKANKVAAGKCLACLDNLVDLDIKIRDYKAAGKDAAAMIDASNLPADKSLAEGLRAQALYLQAGDKPKPDQLKAVHDLLQTALADYPRNVSARFLDGAILARMGQTDAARQQFETCAGECAPTDPYLVRARHFAADPALSYAKMAPAFTVTALDGSKFTLDEMGGRVVLIDFWATWCGPCNEELPHMKRIAKEFAGEPLVIISVSWDDDPAKWQAFINKNEMTWVQYRDADHELSKRYGVDAIPHYFTIDSDGVLTSEMLGSGSDVESKLKKLVTKAKAAHPAAVAAGGD